MRTLSAGLLFLLGSLSLTRCSAGTGRDESGSQDASSAFSGNSIFEFPEGVDDDSIGSSVLNSLCGKGSCEPDQGEAADNECETLGLGGAGGASSVDTNQGGRGGAAPDDDLMIPLSCSVAFERECSGAECEVARKCTAFGEVEPGEACVSDAECSAGSACTLSQGKGICRSYCCAGSASCSSDEYCVPTSAFVNVEVEVPVCKPANDCSLSFADCNVAGGCGCEAGLACIVVSSTGAVACAEPGDLTEGEACSQVGAGQCAPGFLCSASAGCLRLCAPSNPVQCAQTQECQSPSQLDDTFGLCVEGISSSGEEATP